MAGNTKIRITKNDREEFARLAKNTKAKVNRVKKKYGVDLSGEIKVPKLEDFATRKEYNQWKESQSSFTSRYNTDYQYRKNKYDVVATVREINQIKRDTKRAQEHAKKIIKDAENKPFISGGKEQGTVGQRMLQMGKPNAGGINVPPAFDFDKVSTRRRFDEKKENMQKKADPEHYSERNEKMRDNFIEVLEGSFNSHADDLIEAIKKMNPDDFFEIYLMYDEFDFALYDSDGQMSPDDEIAEGTVGQMLESIKEYQSGVNFLKGF